MKSWIRYFVYALILLGLIVLNSYVYKQLSFIQGRTYSISYLLLSVTTLIYMVQGAFLGIEHLLSEKAKPGRWKLNLPKIIFLVIPTLYLSLFLVLYYTGLGTIFIPLVRLLFYTGKYSSTVIYVSQIFFGYFIITSFYKQSNIEE